MDEKSFVSWLKIAESIKAGPGDFQLGNWPRPHDVAEKSGVEQWKRFVEDVSSHFSTIDDAPAQRFIITTHGDAALLNLYPQDQSRNFLRSILIDGLYVGANLKNFAAAELQIRNSRGQFSLKNLMLGSLRISNCQDFSLENCWIGTLHLKSSSVRNFEVRHGGILNIQCPAPTEGNPFSGSVHFDKYVFLPRRGNAC